MQPTERQTEPSRADTRDDVITLAEIAAAVRVSRRTVERWASAGVIPGRLSGLPGRAVRYDRRTVLAWLGLRT